MAYDSLSCQFLHTGPLNNLDSNYTVPAKQRSRKCQAAVWNGSGNFFVNLACYGNQTRAGLLSVVRQCSDQVTSTTATAFQRSDRSRCRSNQIELGLRCVDRNKVASHNTEMVAGSLGVFCLQYKRASTQPNSCLLYVFN